MRATRQSAVITLQKLSTRARQMLAAMFISKSKFNFKNKKEYGQVTTELVLAGVIRVDWDIMHHDVIYLLTRNGHFVVDLLRADRTQHGIPQ